VADQVDRLTLDASGLLAALAEVEARFKSHSRAAGDLTNTYVDLEKRQKGWVATVSQVNDTGQEMVSVIKKIDGEYKGLVKSVSSADEALKKFQQDEKQAAQELGQELAAAFAQSQKLSQIPTQYLGAMSRAQSNLAKAMATDLFNAQDVANELMVRLRSGVDSVETGFKGKIQQALLQMLAVEKQITSETKKQIDNTVARASRMTPDKLAAGAGQAREFFSDLGLGAIPERFESQSRAAISRLGRALAGDLEGGLEAAKQIFAEMQRGSTATELGVRGKIQQALESVLAVQRRITAEMEKQGKSTKASGPSADQLANLRERITAIYPVPSGASINAVASYQSALNRLISEAARGKIPLGDLINLFNQLKAAPTRDFAGSNTEMQRAQAIIQQLISSFNGMKASAKSAEDQGTRTGRSLYISFSQFVKLLEIQIIHRFFGNLITSMQNSIGAAAELSRKIGEIQTISQQSGMTYEQLTARIRGLSEQFGRPMTDVAEATYQAFSNQVIRTASDMAFMNDAMRLARITASDATSAVDALSSVLNSYRMGTYEAGRVSDVLFRAVEVGRFRLRDIANEMGRVTNVAAQMNVRVEEVLGVLSGLTQTGMRAPEALTQIGAVMNAMQRPSQAMVQWLRQFGVETGAELVQSRGLIETLRLITQEADRGGSALARELPNIRAMRLAMAARGAGGQGFADLTRQLDEAEGPARQAGETMANNFGEAFKREVTKIQNFFVQDFGENFLKVVMQLAEPFGGVANMVKSVGLAVIDLGQTLTGLIKIFTDIITVGGTLNVNFGTLVKVFAAYKLSVAAISTAQNLAAFSTSAWNAMMLTKSNTTQLDTAVTTTNQNSTTQSTLAINNNTQAMTLAEARLLKYSQSKTANTLATNGSTAAIQRETLALNANAAGMNTVGTAANTAGVATRFFGLALKALSIIGVIGLMLQLTGTLSELFDKFDSVKQAMKDLDKAQEEFVRNGQRLDEDFRRRQARQSEEFRRGLQETSIPINNAYDNLRRRTQELLDSQRSIVQASSEGTRATFRNMEQEIGRSVSDAKKKISEAETAIKDSLKRAAAFADRDASQMFQHAYKSIKPAEIISGLRPLDFQGMQIQQWQRGDTDRVFRQQETLLNQRLGELRQRAAPLAATGRREDMESYRRMYEEVRRLEEQRWELENNHNRELARQRAEDTARLTGMPVRAQYDVDLREHRRRLDAVRQEEEAGEQRFRARQASEQAEQETNLRRRQAAQAQFQQVAGTVSRFQVADQSGALRRDFRDPRTALQNFDQQFNEMYRRYQEALAGAQRAGIEIAPSEILAMERQLGEQRRALRRQIELQITSDVLTEQRARFQQENEQARAAERQGQETIDRARGRAREAMNQFEGPLRTMLRNMEVTTPSTMARAGDMGLFRLGERTDPLRNRFRTEQQQLLEARQSYDTARGTEGEAAAFARLREATRTAAGTYREFIQAHIDYQQASLREEQQDVGPGRETQSMRDRRASIERLRQELQPTDAERAMGVLEQSRFDVTAGLQQIAQAQQRIAQLREQAQQLPANLAQAQMGLGGVGDAARQAEVPIAQLTASIVRLSQAITTLSEQRPGFVGPPRPGAPVGATPAAAPIPGLASGGLLGNAFTSRGPDDMLINARRGEFVVNPDSTRRFYSQLVAINAGRLPIRGYAEGGMVGTNVGDVHITVNESSSAEETANAVFAKLRREMRKGTGSL
jgi:TP901 family phage tail tape measure protein